MVSICVSECKKVHFASVLITKMLEIIGNDEASAMVTIIRVLMILVILIIIIAIVVMVILLALSVF